MTDQQPLKEVLKQNLNKPRLDQDQLDHLMAMQKAQSQSKGTIFKQPWAMAIGIALVILISSTLFLNTSSKPSIQAEYQQLLSNIANEVTKNHLKLKPLEIAGSNLSDVGAYFTKLDFQLGRSNLFSQGNSQLIGARYCSIKGVTAAQIRYQKPGGGYSTLFEANYEPQIFNLLPNADKGEPPATVYARGLKVKIWIEKGLMMTSVNES